MGDIRLPQNHIHHINSDTNISPVFALVRQGERLHRLNRAI